MRILISNDDGYFSPGIHMLAEHLSKIADITVVAPERDRSGASNSLTLDRPLTVRKAPNGFYYVNGTPTDCVHLAVTGMLDFMPDVVVSGINDGANMGDDTIYSGTVAAATEGYLLGLPSFAVSMAQHNSRYFETAAKVAVEMVEHYKAHPFPAPVLLNINVPDVPYESLTGKAITRLGRRHKAEPAIPAKTPRGDSVFWVGAAGRAQDAGEGTDFHAVSLNRVSITPLQVDLTHYNQLDNLTSWLEA
jgi:5'-nucleotidase